MKIELKNLHFSYNNKNEVLKGVTLSMESQNLYAIVGDNGSGKTTLSKIIMGLLKPSLGEVLIDAQTTKNSSVATIAKRIGYIFQSPDMQLFANTVLEELTFPYMFEKKLSQDVEDKINKALELFGLQELKERLPLTLSMGEKQRLALSAAWIRNTEFLILDEPSASIDYAIKKELADYLVSYTQSGGGVMVISHDEEFIRLLKNVSVLTLKEGRLEV